MIISVVGIGYVGLVTAACFAEMGNTVWCIDTNKAKIERLKQGKVDIYEPGLSELIVKNLKAERLHFSNSLDSAVKQARLHFIAVGTPPKDDGSADLTAVLSVVDALVERMKRANHVIVTKSTVPVGTADIIRSRVLAMAHSSMQDKIHVASNPEFLKEGSAVKDFMSPNRIIVGCDSKKAEKMLSDLYAPFTRNHARTLVMPNRDAEMAKYAANAMLATKISFMNEIANMCDALAVDVENVRVGIGSDERIGYHFIYPGCGYGGSCFPKDVKALVATAGQHGVDASILQAVDKRNNSQKQLMFKKLSDHFKGHIKGKRFAMWGLAFKPETDDMREAPSLEVIKAIVQAGGQVVAYDPIAMQAAQLALDGFKLPAKSVIFSASAMEALNKADALICMTEWRMFRSPDFVEMGDLLKHKLIFDGRNMYDPAQLAKLGFNYYGVGRRSQPDIA